jgi:UDP-N-acetylmuramoyl-tripeptide--D-alanyl-D-alanine ligase
MQRWNAQQVALAAGAELRFGDPERPGPARCTIDSREVDPETLFIGLPGTRTHGGRFVTEVLAAGAWGVLTDPEHVAAATPPGERTVLAAPDPLASLQALALAWRRELAASAGLRVIGVTGSTGKTSTKDLLLALLAPHRPTVASRANFNTEIGLPLEVLRAPAGTEVLVLEMAMRGPGQIAELAAIAAPDVGVIVSVGPVHLELLGSLQAIAAAKAELIAALAPGSTVIVPAHEPLLAPHLREDLRTVTFGPGGEVTLQAQSDERVTIATPDGVISLRVDFTQAHLRRNLLAAVAAAQAVGVTPAGPVGLSLSPGRGQRIELHDAMTLLDDAYNANPMSMRAALDELAAAAHTAAGRRRAVAVLGDMLELGPGAATFHTEIGAYAAARADVLVTVGELAAAMAPAFPGEHHHVADAAAAARMVPELLRAGDVVLVKASHGVGLRRVCEALAGAHGARTPA